MDIRTDAEGWAVESPSPEQVKEIRSKLGWSSTKAANFVHVGQSMWSGYETGAKQMPVGLWNLFLIKAGELRPTVKDIPIVRQLDMAFRPKPEDVIKLRGYDTQADVAGKFGIKHQQWQQWEKGRANIKPWTFEYFALRLGKLRDFPHLFGEW